jgi:hypothetical protein
MSAQSFALKALCLEFMPGRHEYLEIN